MIQIPHALQTSSPPAADTAVSPRDLAIHALLELTEARDPDLLEHSLSVARLSATIATAQGLPAERVDEVRRAALIHDVGKLVLPDAILLKPGPLSCTEYDLVRQHPVVGNRMALGLGLGCEARWVLHHHERPDGRGYPDRLMEGQIPLESEIIHVADAYDALTTDRPYRPAWTRAGALRAIVGGSGWQFNRDCVSALVAATARRVRPLARWECAT